MSHRKLHGFGFERIKVKRGKLPKGVPPENTFTVKLYRCSKLCSLILTMLGIPIYTITEFIKGKGIKGDAIDSNSKSIQDYNKKKKKPLS